MAIEITTYNHSHKEGCLQAFQSNIPIYFTQNEIHDFAEFLNERAIPKADEIQSTFYYVVLKDGLVIGCGGIGERERDGTVTLAWGLIHADYHRQGFGKQLLQYRLDKAFNIYPTKTIFLDTSQHSAPFFAKFGFETTKITDDFYMPGLHRYDMELKRN